MKKFLILMLCFLSFGLLAININAEAVKYKNVITDDTTIKEDFDILGMDINNYYIPKRFEMRKWYLVSMSESLTPEGNIQVYFYMYNPNLYDATTFPELTFDYKLNNIEFNATVSSCLDIDSNRSLYKLKAFQYGYASSCSLNVTNIHSKSTYEDPTFNDNEIVEEYDSKSTFDAELNHKLVNGENSFQMELSFNSSLIIEEIQLVRVNVQPELWETSSFAGWWNTFWDLENKELYLHFYNFNFPDNIKVDSIEYAKFEYDYVYYYLEHREFRDLLNNLEWTVEETISEKNREYKLKEYLPGTNKFETYNQSGELEFETFTLGNRITKGEFPEYVGFSDEEKKLFNYDCSILLDSSVRKISKPDSHNNYYSYYYALENVNFIELHYKNDGVLYKCQVISETVGTPDNPEVPVDGDDPSEAKNPWEMFIDFLMDIVNWFANNWPYSLYLAVGVLLVLFAFFYFVGPLIWPYIPKILMGILKGILWILLLPVKLIKLIIGK